MISVNFMCNMCSDKGKIGFLKKRVCPQCNGDPIAYLRKNKPKNILPPAPQPCTSKVKIEVKVSSIDKIDKKKKSNRHSRMVRSFKGNTV